MAATEGDLNVELGARLNKLERGLKKAERSFNRYADALDKEGKRSATNLSKTFTSSLNKIGGAMAAAFSVQAIAQFTREAVELASKAEGIEHAFKRIGGDNIMAGLREATKGTVADLELMKAAVQANNFQIPVKNLASLFEFARRRAKETGESVDYLVNSIVVGIGRKSPLILDNLGISAVRLRQELKGVGVEAASVGDIAKIIGSIAEDEMRKMGDEVSTTKDSTDKLTASLKNLKVALGEKFISAGGGSLIGQLAEYMELVSKGLKIGEMFNLQEMSMYESTLRATTQGLVRVANESIKAGKSQEDVLTGLKAKQYHLEFQLSQYRKTAHQSQLTIAELTGKIAAYKKAIEDISNPQQQIKKETKDNTAAILAQADAWHAANEKLKEYQMFSSQTPRMDAPNAGDQFSLGVDPSQLLGRSINKMADNSVAALNRVNDQLMFANNLTATLGQAFNQAFSEGIDNGLDFGDALKKMFQSLVKQMISALLTAIALKGVLAALGLGTLPTAGVGALFLGQMGLGGLINATSAGVAGGGGGLNLQVSGKISGSDILLSTERSIGRRTRQTGNNGLIG